MRSLLLTLALCPALLAQSAGDFLFQKKSSTGPLAADWVTPGAPPALFGTTTGGDAVSFVLGSGLAISGSTLSATGGGVWGSITGTLADQIDLKAALDAKLTTATAASTYAPLASPTFTGPVATTDYFQAEDIGGSRTDYSSDRINFYNAAQTFTLSLGGNTSGLTVNRHIDLPSDRDGVVALTDDLTAYAPLASPTFTGTITTGSGGIINPNPGFPTRSLQMVNGVLAWNNVNSSGFGVSLSPTTPTADRIVQFDPNGAIVGTNDTGTVTSTMILNGTIVAADIADSTITGAKLATSYLPLAGGTATGLIQFSGTGHAGLRLNNLTTTQRDALTASAGMAIWNTSTGRLNIHNGTSWSAGMVRLDGDTMTGALNITSGTATSSIPPLNMTQTWNSGATTFRGIEFAVTNTASASTSTLLRLLNGATTAFSVNASTGSVTAGTSNNSVTLTLQGSDRSATLNLGAFGNEFRVNNLQVGQTNAAIRFTDANAVARYGTIYGETTDVLAFRNGSAGTTGCAIELLEMTAPGTPSADRGRVYLEDNGSGKSRLVVKWADGTTSVIVTQP